MLFKVPNDTLNDNKKVKNDAFLDGLRIPMFTCKFIEDKVTGLLKLIIEEKIVSLEFSSNHSPNFWRDTFEHFFCFERICRN